MSEINIEYDTVSEKDYKSTTNPCKVCAPLGACLAIKGVEGSMSILHGSQGCATYIRRYLISHFREPLDIASSSFDESSTIFGGQQNLRTAIKNITEQYKPKLIAVSNTCLADTIGDDVTAWIKQVREDSEAEIVSIKSKIMSSAHLDGFYAAVRSLVLELADKSVQPKHKVNLFPSMYSAADYRLLVQLCRDFDVDAMLMPDYSSTLDGGIWGEYLPIAPGGTKIENLKAAGHASASISFSPFLRQDLSAATCLAEEHEVPVHNLNPPFGVRANDRLLSLLKSISGNEIPEKYRQERARLVDAYADAHKYVFGKKALVYGDADFTAGIASFLDEIGAIPYICISGSAFPRFEEYVNSLLQFSKPLTIKDNIDFSEIETMVQHHPVDFMIGNSKGYPLSRKLDIPLVRAGFPLHDRFGGPRIKHIGYTGAQELLDTIVNTLLSRKQDKSSVGYAYL